MAPHELARQGLARTFQIVQPFVGLTVRDNIAVGAYLRHRDRAAAFDAAEKIAQRLGLSRSSRSVGGNPDRRGQETP